MLIEFKVANFQCFRDEVTLSLQPGGRDMKLRGNLWQGHRYKALKSAAIFGANASGKTSLLHALHVFKAFVKGSATKMNVGDPVGGMDPFRLSRSHVNEPSCFEVLVELDGTGYRYRVEATRKRVCKEVLERQDAPDHSPWLCLIERDSNHIALHPRLGGKARREQIAEDTRDNALVLSRAAERNVQQVAPLYKWFSNCIHHLSAGAGAPPDTFALESIASSASEDARLLDRLSEMLHDADTGIIRVGTESVPSAMRDIRVEGNEQLGAEAKKAVSEFAEALGRLKRTLEPQSANQEDTDKSVLRFFTEHRTAEHETVRFTMRDESAGTRRYLRLVGMLLKHLRTEDLGAIDELQTSLHPQLAYRIIQMVHSPEFGRAGAQLIFTTHDTTLLDPSLLRRDQIILTQKGPDGAAELYSLWDFDDMPRNTAAWARNYLAGRFGGVPVFGPMLSEIPQADEPTPVCDSASEPVEAG